MRVSALGWRPFASFRNGRSRFRDDYVSACTGLVGNVDVGVMASDTTSAAQEAQVVAARRLGPSGRLRAAAELSEDMRRISVEGVLRRHPGYSFEQARREVLR